ncbi:CU044_5270 family protein [Streptomyces sp. JJ36]|uniref:CU044_5270 family protein n=1 Tax=Streptomyces sp. JJ36 TaxID=2736645 RepID=UPI001F31FD0A|nr:CU044_5270 family protein [Streptomyces sp. JJ36]MCF6523361.1 CU044_5270 family protein [Streptomyces sp. JJ36]
MDEITSVRELRADAPPADRARLAPGRRRLLEAAERPAARTRLRVDWRITALGAAAAVAAAALAGAQLAGEGTGGGDPGPAASRVQQQYDLTDAPALLHAAADAAAARPDPEPRVGQWVYRKTVRGNETSEPGTGAVPDTQENWYQYADPEFENWKEGDDHSYRERYEFLAGLPAEPEKLWSEARDFYPSGGDEPVSAHNYRAARVLLQSWPAPPEGLARVYRALAELDGMQAVDHPVEDAQGHPAIALYRETDGPTREEILLDPDTLAYRGSRLVATGNGPVFGERDRREGDVLINSAVLRTAMVDAEGERP